MSVRIALAGNPNSGKTTMFNDLTGSSQRVGNWPGVTVEKKEGRLKGRKDVVIQDLPGIYSLSPYTLEEVVTRNYLINDKPDAIINIVDGSNIERNLYLTTQILELGIPVVIALNMMDVVRKNGDKIDIAKLSQKLGCEIVETAAVKGEGSLEAAHRAIELAKEKKGQKPLHDFSADVEETLSKIGEIAQKYAQAMDTNVRWLSIKLFERDEKVLEQIELSAADKDAIEAITAACEEALDDESESIVTSERYEYISKVISGAVQKKNKSNMSTSDKIDRIVTSRVWGLPIFVGVMFLVYFISITTVGTFLTDWVNDSLFGEIVPQNLGAFLESVNTAPWLYSLIMDGIVAGVGAVLGFLPQMLVLFILLAILEDCGYMARIAFVMDRVFRKFGLSGKSFIPIMIGTGCGVPGIMASRTIENENDRRITAITTTFIPCGAKLPVIAMIAGAFFGNAWWVAASIYFIGIASILVAGVMLKKMKRFTGESTPFVMELPAYHAPKPAGVLRSMWERGFSFIKKAGTIVLVSTVVIWFLSSFNTSLQMVNASESMLASVGSALSPIFQPLGFGEWQTSVGTISGFVAKENVVSTLGVLYGFEEIAEDGAEIWSALTMALPAIAGYSYLLFNMLCSPCFAAIGAMHRELGSARWTLFAVAFQMLFSYAVTLVFYQFALLFSGGGFGIGTAAAIIVLVLLIYLIGRKPYSKRHPTAKTSAA
ncbi:MAG: ferrous iron transport protein B [Christensenellaceae bacterium]|jgi:ferrous iron transport protein B